jgi:apolipoprotein D and lipocalin family protein
MNIHRKMMGSFLLLGSMILSGCWFSERGAIGNPAVPQPAKEVNLQKYLGRWYEIARYEASFQEGCEAVAADYSLLPDGRINVVNTCRRQNIDGPADSATAKAYVVEGSQNAKLRVSFFWPFYGNYWIMDRAQDYDWAIVGEPSGRYLWLLFRTPHPTQDLIESVKKRAAEMGYDLRLLRMTKH